MHVDLLISDLTMRGMSGLERAEYAVCHGGNCPVILCSGHNITADPLTQRRLRIAAALAESLDMGVLIQLADEISPPSSTDMVTLGVSRQIGVWTHP